MGRAPYSTVLVIWVLAASLCVPRATRADSAPPASADDLLTCEFRDVDVRDILRGIGVLARVNVVADETIQGKITIHLQELTIDEALGAICKVGKYHWRLQGRIYYVSKQPFPEEPEVEVEQGLLTLSGADVDVRELLDAVGEESSLNIVPTPDVSGRVTVKLAGVSPEAGLDAICTAAGLVAELRDGIHYVRRRGEVPPTPTATPEGDEGEQDIGPEGEAKPDTTSPPGRIADGRVTLSATDKPLSEVLGDLSKQAGIDIVCPVELTEMVTVRLRDATIEDALRTLLVGTPHTFVALPDGRYLVGDADQLSEATTSPFVSTELIPLEYLPAERTHEYLSAAVPEESVIPIKELNALAVTGTREHIERVKRELALLDKPSPQIMIEAIVVELTAATTRELNFDWKIRQGEFDIDLPLGNLIYSTLGPVSRDILATVQALVTEGKAKVLARPRVATINGGEASINIDQVRYFRTSLVPETHQPQQGDDGGGTTAYPYYAYPQIEEIEAGIRLQITPWAGPGGHITMQINPEVSSVTGTGPAGLPEVNRRTATTTVRVRDGETIVIGGLCQREVSKSVSRTPILSKIPILGNLFTRSTKTRRDTELVILITPRIMCDGDEEQPEAEEATPEGRDSADADITSEVPPLVEPVREEPAAPGEADEE